jgi:Icc-related predicted phosphoesterase
MRIIALADVHGSYGAMEAILEAEEPYDAVVLAGDVTTKGTVQELESALQSLRSYGRPVLAVAGNMDPPLLEQALIRLGVGINGKGRVVGDVGFFGVSACPPTPFHSPNVASEEEIARRAEEGWKDVASARWTLFVPHAPPAQTALDRTFLGTHAGSRSVREFIERRSPHAVVCGHIHEARGVEKLGFTRMVNCGSAARGYYAVVTFDSEPHLECRRRQ